MKVKPVTTLIIISTLLIAYLYVGHDFVKFHAGGKAEILEAGEHINKLCNANGVCPTTLDEWETLHEGRSLLKGNMVYIFASGGEIKDGVVMKKNQTFRLVYRFNMPDDWFEAQGGVGKKVTSGWASR